MIGRRRASGTSLVHRRLAAARAALYWEHLWQALWPTVFLIGCYLALALFDVFALMSPWVHRLLLGGFGLAVTWSLFRALAETQWPSQAAARRRLETAAALSHRPLTALDDRLAATPGDRGAEALWQRHRQRMAEASRHLRPGWPAISLARRDPLALRAALGLVLTIGLAGAWNDVPNRLQRAVSPGGEGTAQNPATAWEIWINPPAYTGAPPVFLSSQNHASEKTGSINIPLYSTLLLQAAVNANALSLVLGGEEIPLTPLDHEAARAETRLHRGGPMILRQRGVVLGRWEVVARPDLPPSIRLQAPPGSTHRGVLRLAYEAEDDYGLREIDFRLTRPDVAGNPPAYVITSFPLPMMESAHRRTPDQNNADLPPPARPHIAYQDLTAHPWAGMKVSAMLRARDQLDQEGTTLPFVLRLPERVFDHPAAKHVIGERKRLFRDSDQAPAIADTLSQLMTESSDIKNNVSVYLALRTSISRLRQGEAARPDGLAAIAGVLWNTALYLEDGDVATAEAALRARQNALQDALQSNASEEEVAALVADLQAALSDYLEALRKAGAGFDAGGGNATGATAIDDDTLRQMVEQAGRLAALGARSAATEMLSRLREILENLQTTSTSAAQQQLKEQAAALLSQLETVKTRQQEIMEQVFARQRPTENRPTAEDTGGEKTRFFPAPGGPDLRQQAEAQANLSQHLQDARQQIDDFLGQAPAPLANAESLMSDAGAALEKNASDNALAAQGQALEQLQKGIAETAHMIGDRLQNMAGTGGGTDPRQGRAGTRFDADGEPLLPESLELGEAARIQEELHRRVGDPSRPAEERRYMERLLPGF